MEKILKNCKNIFDNSEKIMYINIINREQLIRG